MVASREFKIAGDIEEAMGALESHVEAVMNHLELAGTVLPDEYPLGVVRGFLSDAAGCVRMAIEAQQ